MSEAERAAYHGDTPILDPRVQVSADLIRTVHGVGYALESSPADSADNAQHSDGASGEGQGPKG